MKIAIVGKGGVGKTTLSGLLARTFANQGHQVLAVDADPDANLASTLPLDQNELSVNEIVPLAKQKELIKEKVNPDGTLPQGLLLLNPTVDDIIPNLTVKWGHGQRLLVMGWHKGGGQGCYCDENAVLRKLLDTVVIGKEDILIVDSEAGLEQLSRGTARCVDLILVVIEPGSRSIETALAVKKLANDLGINQVLPVLNGYETEAEVEAIQEQLGSWPLFYAIPRIQEIRQADLEHRIPIMDGQLKSQMNSLTELLFKGEN